MCLFVVRIFGREFLGKEMESLSIGEDGNLRESLQTQVLISPIEYISEFIFTTKRIGSRG